MNWLYCSVCVPLFGAFMLFAPVVRDSWSKKIALVTAIFGVIAMVLTVYAVDFNFDIAEPQLAFFWRTGGITETMFSVDRLSVWFLALNHLLYLVVVLSAWNSDLNRPREYFANIFLSQFFLTLFFLADNIVMFYILFEVSLVPMFLMIIVWGDEGRRIAAMKFFLYTMFGSLFMLAAIIVIINNTGLTSISELASNAELLDKLNNLDYIFWFLLLAFVIKLPVPPFHSWLPLAHVEAPTAGSIILAGVVIKMGGYGIIKIILPLFGVLAAKYSYYLMIVGGLAVVYGSFVAWYQSDIKKTIAYSSVAHMGYVLAGIFSLSQMGIDGAIFQMLSHGLISAGLFFCVGVIYNRAHTRMIDSYGGLADLMPIYSSFFVFLSLSSIGLPGTAGFVGEFLSSCGVFQGGRFGSSKIAASMLASGALWGAIYMLMLNKKVIFGSAVASHKNHLMQDVRLAEYIGLLIICALVLFFGICPSILRLPKIV